jgi:hypothetical protein
MQKLEIQFFYPLTDQKTLDLDFTPSEQWNVEHRKKLNITYGGNFLIGSGGTGLTISSSSPTAGSFVIRPPSVKNVGKWEITDSVFVYRPTKPNAVVRFFAKLLLGFKWHDEI